MDPGGYLRWPLAQWAFATPGGILALTLAYLVVGGLPFALGVERVMRRGLARAVDMTGRAPEPVWLESLPEPPPLPQGERWLGHEPAERRANRAFLALGIALTLVLVAGTITDFAYVPTHISRCAIDRCPPSYPTISMLLIGTYGAGAIAFLLHWRWLRRVERACGIRLRRWGIRDGRAIWYVREPGVTAEAAAAALARHLPPYRVPLAREFGLSILIATPLFILLDASIFLALWLPTQWIPG